MKHIIILLVFLASAALPAQEVMWATNVQFPVNIIGMVCSNDGNLFCYGNGHYYAYYNNYEDDPQNWNGKGSYIAKYSVTGSKLAEINWNQQIFINHMVYAGQYFYFTGSFAGNVTLNNSSVNSKGKYDGVVGKMNEKGEVIWLRSFGGEANDMGNGITMSSDGSKIVITGGVDSNLYVMNNLVQTGSRRSALVMAFDLNGTMLNYRLHDSYQFRNFINCGLEIATSGKNYFMLADKDGKPWYDDSLQGTPEGRHIMKLDSSFKELWSQYVISNSCYYGYSCSRISTLGNDVFVPRYCSGKYGGQGELVRYNGIFGTQVWTLNNNDGWYTDTYFDGSRLLYTGVEDANGCPCEYSDPGFGVVKLLNETHTYETKLRVWNCRPQNSVKSGKGTIYVFGYSSSDPLQLGSFSIKSGGFLLALEDLSALSETGKEVFTVYPNPSDGRFRIHLLKGTDIKTIRILNMLGEEIMTASPRNGESDLDLDLSRLPGGNYLVEVSGEGKKVKHICVQ